MLPGPADPVIPNPVNPDSKASQVYATAGVCIPLMLIFATFRWVCKAFYQKAKLVDELVFAAGLVTNLAFISMTIVCVAGGAFVHRAWDDLRVIKRQLVLALLVEITLPVTICLIKVSVLILYLQVFWVVPWLRNASIASIVIITLYHLGMSASFAALCAPSTGDGQLDFLAAFLSPKCTKARVIVVLAGIGNVVTDLWLIVLPLPGVWVLQMPLKRKLAVCSMFSVGIIIVGLAYRAEYYAGDDNISLVVPLWITSIVEEAAGIVICCMPMTAVVFQRAKKPLFTWLSSASSRALRKTRSSSHTDDYQGNLESDSHYQLQESNRQKPINAIYDPISPQGGYATWVNTGAEVDNTQLPHAPMNTIERRTEYQVSRDGSGV